MLRQPWTSDQPKKLRIYRRDDPGNTGYVVAVHGGGSYSTQFQPRAATDAASAVAPAHVAGKGGEGGATNCFRTALLYYHAFFCFYKLTQRPSYNISPIIHFLF